MGIRRPYLTYSILFLISSSFWNHALKRLIKYGQTSITSLNSGASNMPKTQGKRAKLTRPKIHMIVKTTMMHKELPYLLTFTLKSRLIMFFNLRNSKLGLKLNHCRSKTTTNTNSSWKHHFL